MFIAYISPIEKLTVLNTQLQTIMQQVSFPVTISNSNYNNYQQDKKALPNSVGAVLVSVQVSSSLGTKIRTSNQWISIICIYYNL